MANYKLVNSDQLDIDMKTVADKIREKAQLSDLLSWPSGYIEGVDQCSSLNFSVVGGTTQPSDPKENTIWVNTNKEITSWIFSVTKPEAPEEGIVWIFTGTSSVVEFNALKKNGIQVCPLAAKQYVSGAWVDVTAMTYQGGEWVEWLAYLYNAGDQCTDITGGWTTATSDGITLTLDTDKIIFDWTGNGSRYATAYTSNKIDVSKYDTICVNGSLTDMDDWEDTFLFGLVNTNNTARVSEWVVQTAVTEVGFIEAVVDISSINGEYYVALAAHVADVEINKVYLK